MTEMKGPPTPFAQLKATENLHSRVTRALALQVIQADRGGQLIAFPNEAELCKQLGVSRSILREAVKVLENKGMVQVRPRSGTRARPRTDWNQLDPDILGWQSQSEARSPFPARPVRSASGDRAHCRRFCRAARRSGRNRLHPAVSGAAAADSGGPGPGRRHRCRTALSHGRGRRFA